jgi:hypothetical protein
MSATTTHNKRVMERPAMVVADEPSVRMDGVAESASRKRGRAFMHALTTACRSCRSRVDGQRW